MVSALSEGPIRSRVPMRRILDDQVLHVGDSKSTWRVTKTFAKQERGQGAIQSGSPFMPRPKLPCTIYDGKT